jgi:hypothetical protein
VRHGNDRGVAPDAESQCEDNYRGESRTAAERSGRAKQFKHAGSDANLLPRYLLFLGN